MKLLAAPICAIVADKKGRSAIGWFFMGSSSMCSA